MSELVFDDSFPVTLKKAAEKILNANLKVGEKFKSADSYSYLLESEDGKYVGKIFRFEHWPPPGKLEQIHGLLKQHNIPHEEILYSSYDHPIFKNGWQISKYIPGGTARSLRDERNWSKKEYLVELGKLLRQVHQIKLDYFGALHEQKERFDSFEKFALAELDEQDFSDLPAEYSWALEIINQAKKEVAKNLNKFLWEDSTLVHDDANDRNVMWQNGKPILIDWVDSLAGPPTRDFATLTFRENDSILNAIEEGYGKAIDQDKLRLHQIMRFIRLGRFFYFEDKDIDELHKMMERLKQLLSQEKPYGAYS
ncbi:aminoglycoside phosphotransferase family protein [Candidatus Woesebacteria bacterium]|nr:aminoglycoside phosphotransferase family protein [Candidatus Woesebacteria bacterium]